MASDHSVLCKVTAGSVPTTLSQECRNCSIPLLRECHAFPLPTSIPGTTFHPDKDQPLPCYPIVWVPGILGSLLSTPYQVALVPGHGQVVQGPQWNPIKIKRDMGVGIRESVQRGSLLQERRCPPVTFVDLAHNRGLQPSCVVLARVEAEEDPTLFRRQAEGGQEVDVPSSEQGCPDLLCHSYHLPGLAHSQQVDHWPGRDDQGQRMGLDDKSCPSA